MTTFEKLETETSQEHASRILSDMGVKFTSKWIKFGFHFLGDKSERHVFKCTFRRDKKSFSVNFGQSQAEGAKEPTAYDVITCLQKYDVGSFAHFCNDFGYDEDSRREKTYKAVCKEYEKVSDFFTSEELENLQEIQ